MPPTQVWQPVRAESMSPTAATPHRRFACVVFMFRFASLHLPDDLVRAAGLWPVPVRSPDLLIGQIPASSLPELRIAPFSRMKPGKMVASSEPTFPFVTRRPDRRSQLTLPSVSFLSSSLLPRADRSRDNREPSLGRESPWPSCSDELPKPFPGRSNTN